MWPNRSILILDVVLFTTSFNPNTSSCLEITKIGTSARSAMG